MPKIAILATKWSFERSLIKGQGVIIVHSMDIVDKVDFVDDVDWAIVHLVHKNYHGF